MSSMALLVLPALAPEVAREYGSDLTGLFACIREMRDILSENARQS